MTTSPPRQQPPPGQQQPFPPGYPPPGYYPPLPRRSWARRHKFLASLPILGALFLVIGIVAGLSGSQGPSTPAPANPSAASQQAPHAAAPGIGTPVRDGKFQFTVTSVTYANNVGGQFGETAQGRYVLLHITITNIGSQSQMMDDSGQYVFDASGRKYSASSAADLSANQGTSVFLNDINPGNTIRGIIAFDMPKGATPVKAELHDSMFSNGVTVSLKR